MIASFIIGGFFGLVLGYSISEILWIIDIEDKADEHRKDED